jgi:DNA mismatch endonuclease, patch repair protein
MASVRASDTMPEMIVRRLVHRMGYRFRLHAKDLPGTPDLVFRSRRKVIFVHGCFWHAHQGCALARVPKTRLLFWTSKFAANRARDAKANRALKALGFRTLTIWECELRKLQRLEQRLRKFLDAKC